MIWTRQRKRAHILEGLLKALDHIDEVIALIRASRTPDEARDGLMEKFGFTETAGQGHPGYASAKTGRTGA